MFGSWFFACSDHGFCMCLHFFLCGIVLQKCGRGINSSLEYSSSWVKNSISCKPKKTDQYFGRFFHQSAPVKIGLSTCKPSMQEVGFYEAAQNFVYKIYSRVRSKKIKTYSAGWFSYPTAPLSCRSNLTGLYIYVKCKINFKEHTYQRNSLYIGRKNKLFIS
jgi:hypothetical protein